MAETIEKEHFIKPSPQHLFGAQTEKAELERWLHMGMKWVIVASKGKVENCFKLSKVESKAVQPHCTKRIGN